MTLEEYWTEIVADIGNIETHGDAIAAISEKIKTEDTDIGALMSERDELKEKYDAAVAEIKSRWSDLSHGGSITKVTEFGGKVPEAEDTATSINDLDMSQLIMSGKGE